MADPRRTLFISYSRDGEEHKQRVLALSERLRKDGVDAHLDQYIDGAPEQGWARWMLDELDAADHVLVVCTRTYYERFRGHEPPGDGAGSDFEGSLITQEIYAARSRTLKFVPVLFAAGDAAFIPEPLRGGTYYLLDGDPSYTLLYDFLLGRGGVEPASLGEPKLHERARSTETAFGPEASQPGGAAPAVPPGVALAGRRSQPQWPWCWPPEPGWLCAGDRRWTSAISRRAESSCGSSTTSTENQRGRSEKQPSTDRIFQEEVDDVAFAVKAHNKAYGALDLEDDRYREQLLALGDQAPALQIRVLELRDDAKLLREQPLPAFDAGRPVEGQHQALLNARIAYETASAGTLKQLADGQKDLEAEMFRSSGVALPVCPEGLTPPAPGSASPDRGPLAATAAPLVAYPQALSGLSSAAVAFSAAKIDDEASLRAAARPVATAIEANNAAFADVSSRRLALTIEALRVAPRAPETRTLVCALRKINGYQLEQMTPRLNGLLVNIITAWRDEATSETRAPPPERGVGQARRIPAAGRGGVLSGGPRRSLNRRVRVMRQLWSRPKNVCTEDPCAARGSPCCRSLPCWLRAPTEETTGHPA